MLFEQMHASNPLIAVVLVIEANAVLAHGWGVRVVVIRGLIEVTSRYHCHLLYQCPILECQERGLSLLRVFSLFCFLSLVDQEQHKVRTKAWPGRCSGITAGNSACEAYRALTAASSRTTMCQIENCCIIGGY